MSETGVVQIVIAMIVAITPALLARALIVPKITTVEAKANTIIAQNEKLETLANGTHSALTSELSTANARIEGLERLVATLVGHGQKKGE